jgi:2-C-methyl-D-erythritol 4-phosphate cytidylyltransferase
VVVAGGSASRFGSRKQFLQLDGRPVVAWSVAAARPVCDGVVVVVPASPGPDPDGSDARAWGADLVVAGGTSRAASVRAGLAAVPAFASVIVVHDAARPLAPASLFAEVVAALSAGADGVIPVLPVSDTLKRVSGDQVEVTIDRSGLVSAQTPQAFVAAVLRAAHASGEDATDDAGLLEATGATVRTVAGDPRNVKLTHPGDLAVAEALLSSVPVPR